LTLLFAAGAIYRIVSNFDAYFFLKFSRFDVFASQLRRESGTLVGLQPFGDGVLNGVAVMLVDLLVAAYILIAVVCVVITCMEYRSSPSASMFGAAVGCVLCIFWLPAGLVLLATMPFLHRDTTKTGPVSTKV